jgi:hypothetical protein
MDTTKRRQKIREKLDSGSMPKDFDIDQFKLGTPASGTDCVGCGVAFSPVESEAVARFQSEKKYWFHAECEKIWQDERHRFVKKPQGDI